MSAPNEIETEKTQKWILKMASDYFSKPVKLFDSFGGNNPTYFRFKKTTDGLS